MRKFFAAVMSGLMLTAVLSAPVQASATFVSLTEGSAFKVTSFTQKTTAPVQVLAGSYVLVHLYSCCDHAEVPDVQGLGLDFDLVVTHTTGEKRHWVFGASSPDGQSGTLTFTWSATQGRALWTVDAVSGVDLAAPVAQTAWQNSQTNASSGAIDLAPLSEEGVAVAFTLAGSGKATDISPVPPATEVSEVGHNAMRINAFWSSESHLAATFLGKGGPQVMSWLMLAVELRLE